MFDFLFSGIASLLDLAYRVYPSYGFAIVMLTLVVMVLLTPIQLRQTRAMLKMQELAPELKRIQNAYRGDREAMNRELMKFYQEHQLNPLAGCLPLVLQMPVFLVLFQVLRGLSARTDGVPDPKYLDHTSELYRAIVAAGGELRSWGMDLARSPSDALSEGFVHAIPYLILIVVVAVSGWYQQRQIQARQRGNVNPQQQAIMKVMPLLLPVISYTMPAGLVVYFATSNVYRVLQQAYITRTLYGPPERSGGGEPVGSPLDRLKGLLPGSGGSGSRTPPKGARRSSKASRRNGPDRGRGGGGGSRSRDRGSPPPGSGPGGRPRPRKRRRKR